MGADEGFGVHALALKAVADAFQVPARTVLRELRALSGGSPNNFPSPGKGDCMSSNTMLYPIYRMGYHGRATTHGFRAVASTILNETNLFNRDWIERQLSRVHSAV
jgi:hypothetical protein